MALEFFQHRFAPCLILVSEPRQQKRLVVGIYPSKSADVMVQALREHVAVSDWADGPAEPTQLSSEVPLQSRL
jgi:hypothetical protein